MPGFLIDLFRARLEVESAGEIKKRRVNDRVRKMSEENEDMVVIKWLRECCVRK